MTTKTRALLLALSCALLSPQAPARASDQVDNFADSDTRVPLFVFCEPDRDWLGHYRWRHYGDEVKGRILVNWCRLAARGAGPTDFHNILLHEWAHSQGLNHGEGDPRTNSAYYQEYELCRY